MENAPAQPARMRQLGQSRTYTCADLPKRLTHWHAPRANRWERLCVTTGQLCTQWLDANGAAPLWLQAGSSRWIAPGTRWYVADMSPDTRFELQIYADDATPVSAPQPLRTTLLDTAVRTRVDDVAAFTRLATHLATGDGRLLQGCYDCSEVLNATLTDSGQYLLWHPLYARAGNYTAFLARSAQPVGLLDYLGHDHAVIEAALAGALGGDAEYIDWLHAVLARHLAIEEQLLFPAYLEAGGHVPWIKGLTKEHVLLRRHLDTVANPDFRRRFLLLLDAHDEKEEQIVYPDIVSRLGANVAAKLTRSAMLYPLPATDPSPE